MGVSANNVLVSFHRTLRVPEARVNDLPEVFCPFHIFSISNERIICRVLALSHLYP